MNSPRFTIPDEYQADLEYVDSVDPRSDEEILQSIATPSPATTEKNIWAYWHAGLQAMPGWNQRNIISWARLNPGWTIRVLDDVPGSPSHALNYLPADTLPECFVRGTMDGVYRYQHCSDFIRAACLWLHGGVYMDVGIMLIRPVERICWMQLEDPQCVETICVPNVGSTYPGNYFIASRKGDPFIERWHRLQMILWSRRNNHVGICNNALMEMVMNIINTELDIGSKCDLDIGNITAKEYGVQLEIWARMCILEDAGDGFNCAEYAQKHILWLDFFQETCAALAILQGQPDVVGLWATQYNDSNAQSADLKLVYQTVWGMLASASMQKLSSKSAMTRVSTLGTLWSQKEHEGKDCVPGTFADLLRYGCVHFQQKRESICFVEIEKPVHTVKLQILGPHEGINKESR